VASGEPIYSFRIAFPDVLQIKRAQTVRLEASRAGAIVAPGSASFRLLAPDGTVRHSEPAPTIAADGAVEVLIPASALDPDTSSAELGELYQEEWSVVMPGEADARLVRRQAALARFVLHPPTAEADVIVGEYPDLVDQLGSSGDTLQPYLDKAWGWALRRMFRSGAWPDLLVSVEDLSDLLEHRTLFGVFKFLFSRTSGDGSRFETLMAYHRDEAEREWSRLSGRWDHDHDGRADDLERSPASTAIHQNAAPRARLRRSRRW
tara:strand:- start:4727 stop:5515 length:789 start_codon:yes stop_codon:yes gene_type:complete